MGQGKAQLSLQMSRASVSLWSPNDTVKDAAEVLGVTNLPDDVAKAMAMDVEYRLHEVVEQARKFMRHSKRRTLTTRDISAALRVLNVEPLYGYDSQQPHRFKEALVGTGQSLYYLDEEEEVDFDRLISEPIPKVPREPTFTAHWLAIEGVQPAIPQNPHIGEIRRIAPSVRGSQVTYSTAKLGQDAEVKPLVKHMISKELQLYFDRIVEVLLSNNTQPDGKPSEEYTTALYSLRNDPGLHQLTPYFIQFVQEKVSSGLKGPLSTLNTMLAVLEALLANPTIFVGPYIHQIVPAVLTVLVAKHITDGGYEVRSYAASLLRKIVSDFGSEYTQLRPRLTRTLLKGFMDIHRPLESLCGIVQGVACLGPEVVLVIIVGNLDAWLGPVSAKGKEEPAAWNHLKEALANALALAPEAKDAVEQIMKA